MKARHLQLISFVAFTLGSGPAGADWVQHGQGEDEVRVWASPKEAGMSFNWSGKTNARHEAEGVGILEWYKIEKQQRIVNLVYTGELKAGRRDGTGVSLQRSGAKYSGQWSNNVKAGKGEYWYANGDYYAGLFRNDVMHGAGRYISADGTVFEGTFVADERDGPGDVISPDGRRYSSTWKAGKDTNPAGAPLPEKPYLTLGTDVRPYALDGKIFLNSDTGPAFYLTYRGRSEDGTFVIDSDWPYWIAWSKGGPVVTADVAPEGSSLGTYPVFLDLRLVNRGRETLEIRKAEMVVEESYADLEPILQIRDASSRGGVSCDVVNFTANPVESCEVAFNVLPKDATPTFTKFQFVEEIEPFTENARFSLARALTALKLDAAAIAAIETPGEDSAQRAPLEQRVRQSVGKFPGFVQSDNDSVFLAYSLIEGELRLGWTDHTGAKRSKRVLFQFRKCFAQFGVEEAVEGPSSGKYDVMLKATGQGYLVPFTYKRSLAANANDRFTVQVASPASSYHRFRIRLTAVDGREILSPPCRLHFLVPRNFSWREGRVIEKP